MNHTVVRALVIALLLPSAMGCLFLAPDTCSQGKTMGEARLANGIEGTDDAPFLRLRWDVGTERGAELPPRYFERARLDDNAPVNETGEDITSAIELTAERELTIRLLPASAWRRSNGRYVIVIALPSRVDFIDCMNPPHDDQYTISIEMLLDAGGALVQTTIDEQKHLQPI